MEGERCMHWIMWCFWGLLALLVVGGYVVDYLTKGKYKINKQEKSLNQNVAEADALRDVGRYNNQSGL